MLKQRRTGPEIEVAQDELAAIVDPYGLRVADFAADSFQCLDHVFVRPISFRTVIAQLGFGDMLATRWDRCPEVFLSATALAATVRFWLWARNET